MNRVAGEVLQGDVRLKPDLLWNLSRVFSGEGVEARPDSGDVCSTGPRLPAALASVYLAG